MIRSALIAALVCCACKDSVIPVSTIRGTYALRTVDGAPLPFTVSTVNGSATAIVADSITLLENSVFHEAGTRSVTTNGVATRSSTMDYGSYGLLSTSITFHSDADGVNRGGQIEGTTMTIVVPGHVQVYQKLN